ncbi:MAG: hypothetical protein SGI74_03130 [Oligoflexia bacterium]|nr:hypothetical protein [Oligoflexia bacterium]
MKNILNQSGQLTVDFMFSLILIISISTLLGALTFALTLTEVVQYVSFAGSRAYFAADLTETDQKNVGNNKMEVLTKSLPFLASAQKAGWIVLPPQSRDVGDFTAYREQINAPSTRNQFVGAQIKFIIPILNLNLPFLGEAIEPPNGGSFKATVSSFLLREPSFQECSKFMSTSYKALLEVVSPTCPGGCDAGRFIPITDNGC